MRQVVKAYGDHKVVRGIDLEVARGELVALLGASGCGKTTTLKMINRLIEPTSGAVLVRGVDVMSQDPIALRRSIGYVFQGIGLFPHRTVFDNVATVSCSVNWAIMKIDSTNIRISSSAVITSTKPGQTEASKRAP
ncbi:MAG: ATP-binding cassette domain-containing protein, partial [Myxococcota bacterium]